MRVYIIEITSGRNENINKDQPLSCSSSIYLLLLKQLHSFAVLNFVGLSHISRNNKPPISLPIKRVLLIPKRKVSLNHNKIFTLN